MILAAILKNIFKKNADLEPFGGKYTPMEKQAQKAFHEKHSGNSNKSDDGPGYVQKPAGPTPAQLVAQQVAAQRAAKLAAKKKMGQTRRKKYEAARTMAKKMKLLFVD